MWQINIRILLIEVTKILKWEALNHVEYCVSKMQIEHRNQQNVSSLNAIEYHGFHSCCLNQIIQGI